MTKIYPKLGVRCDTPTGWAEAQYKTLESKEVVMQVRTQKKNILLTKGVHITHIEHMEGSPLPWVFRVAENGCVALSDRLPALESREAPLVRTWQ